MESSQRHEGKVVARATGVADEVLFPLAQTVDRSSIPATHFDALRAADLFAFADVAPGDVRRAMAAIAGGCGATFFVWVQHHGVVRNVATSSNTALRRELLPSLLDGSVIAGTAFAHARRTGSAAVRATRVDGGWRLDGRAPWATSWGIAEQFAVAATTDDGRMVWSILPGHAGAGVTTEPLDLPVFSATGTVAIDFDSAPVADAHVLAVADADEWRNADRIRSSLGAPAVLGVAERAIRLLHTAARRNDDPARTAAQRLESELSARWQTDDELASLLADAAALAADPALDSALDGTLDATLDSTLDDAIATASTHRAACLDLGNRATTALLAAVGGGGMDLSHPAQRLAREAAFYVIQAQTGDGRSATLDSV